MFKNKEKPVILKDLLNDLEREDKINDRIKDQLHKNLDLPRSFNSQDHGSWGTTFPQGSSFLNSSAQSFIPQVSFLPGAMVGRNSFGGARMGGNSQGGYLMPASLRDTYLEAAGRSMVGRPRRIEVT
jgi:hypothetical protein